MVWKTGKFGVNNGRTVRSTRAPGKRSEGLLIQTTAFTEGNRDQEETKTITFSLGKQNRWLLPEVIKGNSIEVEKEEVVLVERYTNEGHDRPDCFSVYNSKSRTTRKSKGKFARANDLLGDFEEMKTRYEVSYPHPSGSWQNEKQWRRQTKHLGTRKKNSFANRNIEKEFEEVNEPDLPCHEIDEFEDLNTHFYPGNSDRSVTFDLGLFLKNSTQKKKKCSAKTKSPWQMKEAEESKELTLSKGECIYIESSDDMYDTHHKLLVQIQETLYDNGSYDTEDWTGGDLWHLQGRGGWRGGRGRGRGGWRGRGRGRGRGGVQHYIPNETLPSADPNLFSETSEPSTKSLELSVEDSYDQFATLDLTHTETNPTLLKERWGEKYKEAASLPRAFILNATPDTSLCNGGEVFVLFQLDCEKHDTRKVKARVSTVVICNEEGMHESVLAEFISKIKARSAEADTCSLEEVVNIANSCFYPANTDIKADESEPRQPKLSLDVFAELFGWNSKALSLKRAQQEVKMYLTNKEKGQSENAHMVVPMLTADHSQRECGICFMELQYDGKLHVCSKSFCFIAHDIRSHCPSGTNDCMLSL